VSRGAAGRRRLAFGGKTCKGVEVVATQALWGPLMSIWLLLRIEFDVAIGIAAIGPHRAGMLEAIDRFGSISAAAPAVDLTFRQLWRLVQALNSFFNGPLIGIRRSGRSSGAFLTPLGKEVLARYREMERVANQALEPHYREFEKLVGIDSNTPPPVPRYAQVIDPSTVAPPKKKRVAAKARQKARRQRTRKKQTKKTPVKSSLSATRR